MKDTKTLELAGPYVERCKHIPWDEEGEEQEKLAALIDTALAERDAEIERLVVALDETNNALGLCGGMERFANTMARASVLVAVYKAPQQRGEGEQ